MVPLQVKQKKCKLSKLEKAIQDTKSIEERYGFYVLGLDLRGLVHWVASLANIKIFCQELGATCNE